MNTDLAGKYRPKMLDDLIGQEVVVRTLSNAIKRDMLHHAFLFVGLFGSGKCVTGDTLIKTSSGLRRIDSIVKDQVGFHDIKKIGVYDESGLGVSVKGYFERDADTIKITTYDGFRIEATEEHPIRVWTPSGLKWRTMGTVCVGDFLPISRKVHKYTPSLKLDWDMNISSYMEQKVW